MKQTALQGKVAIAGVGTTMQGLHPQRHPYGLAVDALRAALDDSGVTLDAIDGVVGYAFHTEGTDPLDLCRFLGLSPRVTAYIDYGAGGFTLQHAAMLVATGVCQTVAAVFARTPAGSMVDFTGLPNVFDKADGLVNGALPAALGWSSYMARYGVPDGALAPVAVSQKRWANLNPIAAWKGDLTQQQYLASPFVIWPFREWDIARVTAGGAAFIVTSAERAKDLRKKPVYFHAVGRQQTPCTLESEGFLLMKDAMGKVAEQVYGAAGLSPDDVDILYASDASSAAVAQTIENYGFCGEGEVAQFIKNGRMEPGGGLPVNTGGGQLSEGYMVGWLHHAELVRQLRGEGGARQVAGARVAQYTATGRFRNDFLSTIFVS
ncbi:MAG: thiolase family protein [Burkholderiaceae bacterium]|nr:thiolase family protein [Burkholderiaceae bacterium]